MRCVPSVILLTLRFSRFQNSPNDLQMLSDAPAHHLFCLLPPVPPTQNSLPEVLAVVQVIYGVLETYLKHLVFFYFSVLIFSGPSGVSGGRDIKAVHPQQSVQREEGLR